LALFLWQQSEG